MSVEADTPGRQTPVWKSPEVYSWAAFGLLVLFFLMLKSYSLHWQTGDENVYFYMAWATADHGALPYGDYFFAHPPLHLFPGVILFGLFGFGPVTARLIPVGATLVGALFLFLLARRQYGRLGAVASLFLYLTTFSLLRASTHWTGINLSVMWVVIGLWAFFRERPATSGACLALGVCTGNYVLPGAMMLGLLALLRSRRDGLRYLIGFVGPWLLVQIVGLFMGGKAYLDAVYRYHVAKPQASGASWKMSVRVFTDNFALFVGVLLGPLMAALERRLKREEAPVEAEPKKKKRKRDEPEPPAGFMRLWLWWRQRLVGDRSGGLARVGGLWTLGYLVFIAMLPRVFPFYFLLLFPAMALAGGYAVERVVVHAGGLVRDFRQRDRKWVRAAAVLGGVLLAVLIANLVRVPVQRGLLPRYVRLRDKPMKWSDAPLPGFVNRAFRWCCWDDLARARTEYGTIQELLYHESRYFEQAGNLAGYVTAHTGEKQTIFGDSSTAGIVALLAERRLSADFTDTNTMRFLSGITPVFEALKRIDNPDLAMVLVSGARRGGRLQYGKFARLPAFRRWLDDGFEIAHQVADRTKGRFFLLRRKTSQ